MAALRSRLPFVRLSGITQLAVWGWSAGITLTMGLACAAMMAYGGGQPTANHASDLGMGICGAAACFRGVVPGQTGWENALAALGGRSAMASRLPYRDMLDFSKVTSAEPSYTLRGHLFFSEVILYPSSDNRLLGSVFMRRPLAEKIPVADILALYGLPNCVDTIYHAAGTLLLHYRSMHISVQLKENHFGPETPVTSIVLGDVQEESNDPCDPEHMAGDRSRSRFHWAGFTTVRRTVMAVP
jgi:hypothetical protein